MANIHEFIVHGCCASFYFLIRGITSYIIPGLFTIGELGVLNTRVSSHTYIPIGPFTYLHRF
jgi:hypothetical protein